jgi:hypothetical protein
LANKSTNALPNNQKEGCPYITSKSWVPLETLNFVAAYTKTIGLGKSVIDILFHNPIVLARRFATLDVVSGGEIDCWIGQMIVKRGTRPRTCPLLIEEKQQMNMFRY